MLSGVKHLNGEQFKFFRHLKIFYISVFQVRSISKHSLNRLPFQAMFTNRAHLKYRDIKIFLNV